jgi:fatty-acyl-CoA synthase
MYIGDYLGRRELYSPDRLAIIDAGKTPELRLTFQAWNRRVNRLANWLRTAAGVGYRDRVAILAQDGVEHLDVFHACSKLGAIHTALNWRLHWRELVDIIANTTPLVLIFSDKFKGAVAELMQASAGADHTIAHLVHIDGDGLPGSLHYDAVLAGSPETPVTYAALEAEDIACLLFTGGTTGRPKGAQISHRQICWNVLNTVIHDVQHHDIYLKVFPLFHTGGLFT